MNRENDVGFMIKQIHDDLGRYLNQRLKSEGITSAQAEVLHVVGARAGERTTLRDVEEFLGVSHPTVVGLVRRLCEKGLLRSEQDPADGRARNLSVIAQRGESPDQGEAVLCREDMLSEGVTKDEREQLVKLLRRVRKNLRP